MKEKFMHVALNLAKRHQGMTASNPSVGCIIVRDEKIIASAVTAKGGRPHAEKIALSHDNISFKGAEIYSTLEPCSHYGKTPPCTESIIEKGISKVFIGIKDKDSRVNGQGIKILQDAGIKVEVGVLAGPISQFYLPYIQAKTLKRPFVTVKIASSMDGKCAYYTGNTKWITCEKSRQFTNFLRYHYDAILVGRKTYQMDLPALTCRVPGLEEFSPQRFILSSTMDNIKGFNILNAPPHAIVDNLYKKLHINHLLIEGGGEVITSFLQAKLVDEIILMQAPIFIGENGKPSINLKDIETESMTPTYKIIDQRQIGECLFIRLQLPELNKLFFNKN